MEEVKPKPKGGYRPGAGRPKGAKNLLQLPKKAILEYTTEQELKHMVERAKRSSKRNDKMLQWYLEMCFGKPKVVEKDPTPKTVNNIAYFLDSLEGKPHGPATIEQGVQDAEFIQDQEQGTEGSDVPDEPCPSPFQPE